MASQAFSTKGLELQLEEKPLETIVRCSGRITAESAEWFQREVRDRIIPESRGKGVDTTQRVVLDLSGIAYIDSTGLGALLSVWTHGQRKGCDLEIVNPNARVEKLVAMSKLDRVFTKMKDLFGSESK